MSRARLSTALVALSATGFALLSPVTAQAAEDEPDLSAGCQEEVDKAKEEHEKAVAEGTVGSSLIGPEELVQGLGNGYGSSGMPEVPECVEEEQTEEDWKDMPEWMMSLKPGAPAAEIISIVSTVVGLGAAVIQGLVIVAQVNPAVLEPVRAALKQAGFNI